MQPFRPFRGAALVAVLLLAMSTAALAANPNSTPTTSGAELTVQINTPADGSTVTVGQTANATGLVTINDTTGAGTSVSYIMDLSGSTTFVSVHNMDCDGDGIVDAQDDFNGDGVNGDINDCEISGVLALNESIAGSNPPVNLTVFGQSAAAADMTPAGGDDPFTLAMEDADSSGTTDLEEVARSTNSDNDGFSFVGLFTNKVVGSTTNFGGALAAMNGAFDSRPAEESKLAFFLTDGESAYDPDTDPALAEAIADGVVINTFSVGSGSADCLPGEDIFEIADRTGGECTEVDDPTDLTATLGGATPTDIDRVEVALNGGTPVLATINAVGGWTAHGLGTYVLGPNTITATAFADDGTSVTADITVIGDDAPGVDCDGLTPTMVGTAGDDMLTGTPGHDVIAGLEGNDTILGLGGDDVLCGGPGNDYIDGGTQQDRVLGEEGNDTLRGGPGEDVLDGAAGRDVLRGNGHPDLLIGGTEDDRMFGGHGADRLEAGPGDDLLEGGPQNDILYAGDGNDTLQGDAGNDTLRGESGDDNLLGGDDDDRLFGGPDIDACDGEAGTNIIAPSCEII